MGKKWVRRGSDRRGTGSKRRKAVLEDDHVVLMGRDLRRHRAAAARAQGALVGRGQKRAVLAMVSDGDPVPGQRILTHHPRRRAIMQRAFVNYRAALRATQIGLGVVEIDELATVGQGRGRAANPRGSRGALSHEFFTVRMLSSCRRADSPWPYVLQPGPDPAPKAIISKAGWRLLRLVDSSAPTRIHGGRAPSSVRSYKIIFAHSADRLGRARLVGR